MNVFGFFTKKTASKDIAKDRLKLILIHDRVNCSTEILEMMKNDIIKVISGYMEIDEEELEIQVSQTAADEPGGGGMPMLYANIPIKSVRKASKQ